MEIIYKPNKKRLLSMTFIIIIFLISSFFFIIKPDVFAETYFVKSFGIFGKPISIRIIGILILLIMFLFFIGTINLIFQNYVLIINEKGFVNNTNFTNVGLILWDDVKNIKINRKKHNSLIFIVVKDEKKYINRIKNPIIRLNAITYKKTYNASFVIETAYLKTTEDELMEIFRKHTKL